MSIENGNINLTNLELHTLIFSSFYTDLISCRDLSAKTKFKLAKLSKKVSEAYEPVQKIRLELLEKHANKDEDGKPIIKNTISGDNSSQEMRSYDISPQLEMELNREVNELLAEQADIDGEKITLNLDEIPDGVLSAIEMNFLSNVINFEE